MTYKNFKLVKKYIHFNDNAKVDSSDNVFKLRPIIRALNINFKKFGIFEKNISVDEQMVPYTGKHSIRMFMKNKPVRFGFKQWVMGSLHRDMLIALICMQESQHITTNNMV